MSVPTPWPSPPCGRRTCRPSSFSSPFAATSEVRNFHANGQPRRLRFRCGSVMQEKLAPPPLTILSPWLSTLAQTIPHALRATAAADASATAAHRDDATRRQGQGVL